MRRRCVRPGPAAILGLWLAAASQAWAAGHGDVVEAQFRALQDASLPDEQRAAARNNIINIIYRGDKAAGAAVERLLKLGNETTSDRTRLDVAFILGQVRARKTIVPPAYTKAAVALASGWLDGKETDAGVRLWAAVALAVTNDLAAVPFLKDKALGPQADPVVRVAVARALAGWHGDGLESVILPLLLEMLKDKEPEIRIAGCDALRLTRLDSLATVEPLLEVAKREADERVWRAAVFALRSLAGGALMIAGGAPDEERRHRIQLWENAWRRKKRLEAK